jgi:uncharacterized YigZ family protein
VLARSAEAELKEKKSRFLGILVPAATAAEAKQGLETVIARTGGATHHCWAWRLGPAAEERSSDAGEPAGTAGAPMLQVLRGADLSDVLAVVVRWYGGVKLGKGGLARAYAEAVRLALEHAGTEERFPRDTLRVRLPYHLVGAVKRLVHPPEVELAGEDYGEAVTLVLDVHRHRRQALDEALADLALTAVEVG